MQQSMKYTVYILGTVLTSIPFLNLVHASSSINATFNPSYYMVLHSYGYLLRAPKQTPNNKPNMGELVDRYQGIEECIGQIVNEVFKLVRNVDNQQSRMQHIRNIILSIFQAVTILFLGADKNHIRFFNDTDTVARRYAQQMAIYANTLKNSPMLKMLYLKTASKKREVTIVTNSINRILQDVYSAQTNPVESSIAQCINNTYDHVLDAAKDLLYCDIHHTTLDEITNAIECSTRQK